MSRSFSLALVTLDLLMAGCASQAIVGANPAPAPAPQTAWAGWSQVATDAGFLPASAPVRPQLPAAPKGPHYVLGDPYQFDGTWYRPQADYEYEESGLASIYDRGNNGQVTADGEVYSDSALTAAHKTLPLPSMVRVTNLDNGKSVEVRVNDRGPFVDNRVIQLSQHAGDLLGIGAGDAIRVHVEIMPAESRTLAMSLGASGRDEIPSLPAVPSPKLTVQTLNAELPTLRPQTAEMNPGRTSPDEALASRASVGAGSESQPIAYQTIESQAGLRSAASTAPGKIVTGPQYASLDEAMPPSTLDQTAGARYVVGAPYQFDGVWYRPTVDYGYDATGSAVIYDSGASGEATANGEIYQADALTAAHKTLPLPSLVQVTNLDNGRTVTVRVNDRGPFVDSQLIELSRGAGAAIGINPGDVVRVRVQVKADESRELAAWFAAADRLKQNPPVLPGTNTAELPKLKHQIVIGPQFAALDGGYVSDVPAAGNAGESSAAAASSSLAANADELGLPLDLTRLTASGRPVLLLSLQGSTAHDPANVKPAAVSAPPGIYVQAGAFRQLANAKRLRDSLADLGDVSLVSEPWSGGEVNCVRLGPLATATDAQHVMDELTDRGYRDSWLLVE
jgi:rare lipoprotein A